MAAAALLALVVLAGQAPPPAGPTVALVEAGALPAGALAATRAGLEAAGVRVLAPTGAGVTGVITVRGATRKGRRIATVTLTSADSGREVATLRLQAKQPSRLLNLLERRVGAWALAGLPLTRAPRPRPKVSIAGISGRGRRFTEPAILAALERTRGIEVVPAPGAAPSTPAGRAAAARAEGLALVVTLELSRSRGRHVATVRHWPWGQGQEVKETLRARRPAALATAVARVVAAAAKAAQEAGPPPLAEGPDAPVGGSATAGAQDAVGDTRGSGGDQVAGAADGSPRTGAAAAGAAPQGPATPLGPSGGSHAVGPGAPLAAGGPSAGSAGTAPGGTGGASGIGGPGAGDAGAAGLSRAAGTAPVPGGADAARAEARAGGSGPAPGATPGGDPPMGGAHAIHDDDRATRTNDPAARVQPGGAAPSDATGPGAGAGKVGAPGQVGLQSGRPPGVGAQPWARPRGAAPTPADAGDAARPAATAEGPAPGALPAAPGDEGPLASGAQPASFPDPAGPPRDPPAASASTLSPSDRRSPALIVAAGLGLLGRQLRYRDDLFGELRPYDLKGTPTATLEAVWYPGRHLGGGPLGAVGLEGRGTFSLAAQSRDSAGHTYGTTAYAVEGATRGRWALGPHEVGAALGGGLQAFRLAPKEGAPAAGVPGVGYAFVRLGVDAALRWSALTVRPRVGVRYALTQGELGSPAWFPEARAWAFDGELGVAWALTSWLEVRGAGNLTRYHLALNPAVDAPRVAGGAVDQYWGATLGAAFHLDGG
jgi:hypothetical protein